MQSRFSITSLFKRLFGWQPINIQTQDSASIFSGYSERDSLLPKRSKTEHHEHEEHEEHEYQKDQTYAQITKRFAQKTIESSKRILISYSIVFLTLYLAKGANKEEDGKEINYEEIIAPYALWSALALHFLSLSFDLVKSTTKLGKKHCTEMVGEVSEIALEATSVDLFVTKAIVSGMLYAEVGDKEGRVEIDDTLQEAILFGIPAATALFYFFHNIGTMFAKDKHPLARQWTDAIVKAVTAGALISELGTVLFHIDEYSLHSKQLEKNVAAIFGGIATGALYSLLHFANNMLELYNLESVQKVPLYSIKGLDASIIVATLISMGGSYREFAEKQAKEGHKESMIALTTLWNMTLATAIALQSTLFGLALYRRYNLQEQELHAVLHTPSEIKIEEINEADEINPVESLPAGQEAKSTSAKNEAPDLIEFPEQIVLAKNASTIQTQPPTTLLSNAKTGLFQSAGTKQKQERAIESTLERQRSYYIALGNVQ